MTAHKIIRREPLDVLSLARSSLQLVFESREDADLFKKEIAAPSVNPWVSVDGRVPPTAGYYIFFSYGDIHTVWASELDKYYKHDIAEHDLTHVWDESKMKIPRPE